MPSKATKKSVKAKTPKSSAKRISKESVETTAKNVAKKVKKAVHRNKVTQIKNAPSGQEFYLLNGKKIKNYKELATVMEHLEDNVFRHHVNPEKNDFANWIRDVFKDVELAKKIAGIDSKEKLELVLHRTVVRGK